MLKVFLVEDEFVIREGIKNNIDWKAHGYEFCGEAGDGELAYPMIQKLRPDIVITDIRMPFMDGLELSRLIRKELPVYLKFLALINLIRNALQAVEGQEDGIVRVDTCAGATGHLLIIITDNGPGIPPERLSAIFTPFFSTKSGGSGIGLPISQRIMQLHGGQLSVSSIPNVRTEFRMEF